MRVQNNSQAIEKALRLDEGSVKHAGNFIFTGKLNGHDVVILTAPADGNYDTISVLNVDF